MGDRATGGREGRMAWGWGIFLNFAHGNSASGSLIRSGCLIHKSQRYLFNAIPDTNHNANPTNPNRYSKGNPNPTNPTNPTRLLTLLTLILDIGLSNPRIIDTLPF